MGLTLCKTARRINRLKRVCVFIPPGYESGFNNARPPDSCCSQVHLLNSGVASGVNFDKRSPARRDRGPESALAKDASASDMRDGTRVHGSSFAEGGASLWDRSFAMIFSDRTRSAAGRPARR
jgi:hypothetical protein